MNRELVVLLDSEPTGVLRQNDTGQIEMRYDQAWRDRSDSYPVSLSMPLTRGAYPDSAVRPFMEGLLPDNQGVLNRWAQQFHVSAANPFALLTHMGEDCAGAVQFVRPERLDAFLRDRESEVQWLSKAEVAERLRNLVEDSGTGRRAGDRGYFSLAGAQPKTALIFENERWGIPAGRIPTTHILKPPAQPDLPSFEINEHFCLALASELGLAVPRSEVRFFEDQVAIVVARYDRARLPSGRIVRVHQEDACQALSVPPSRKYEAEAGPGPTDMVRLLLKESDDPDLDVSTFLDALALNWAIAGTDAHAKNYSLLIQPGSVRLAPLYDLVSVLPYPHWIPYRKAKLAMRIDREYSIWKIRARHWEGLAQRCGLDVTPVLERVGGLVAAIPAATSKVADSLRRVGINAPIIDELETEVGAKATRYRDYISDGLQSAP